MARLSGKLTPKAMGWDRSAIGEAVKAVPATGRVELGTVVGIVAGLKTTVDDNTGEVQYGLKGEFRGVSAKSEIGEVNAGVCYLPGGMQGVIEGQLAKAQDEQNGGHKGATVQFGLKLFAIPANNRAGYSFEAETLVQPVEASPLDMLFNQATGQLSLPAPDADGGEVGEVGGNTAGENEPVKAPAKGAK